MTSTARDQTLVERGHQAIGRGGFFFVVAGLLFGMALLALGVADPSVVVLKATCMLLLVLPAVNVAAVCAEEVRRRDWVFALVGVAVMALLGYNVLQRI